MSWPAFAKAAEIMNYLKTNLTDLSNKVDSTARAKRPYSDEIKGSAVCTVKGAYTTVVEVSGSGAFLGAFMASNSQESGGVRVTIDDEVVFQAPVVYNANAFVSGLVSGQPFVGDTGAYYFRAGTINYTEQLTLPFVRAITDTAAPYGIVARRISPIKFNTSLIIEGYRSTSSVGSTGITLTYAYYVD